MQCTSFERVFGWSNVIREQIFDVAAIANNGSEGARQVAGQVVGEAAGGAGNAPSLNLLFVALPADCQTTTECFKRIVPKWTLC